MTDTPEIEITPRSLVEPLELDALFGRVAPIEIDVGAGEGGFLLAMAQKFPDVNFLAFERMARRVRAICRGVKKAGAGNVRVLRLESSYAIRCLIPAESVSTFYVSFPDPWPKRRHWPRRLINPGFIESAGRALRPGGEIRIVTDHADYFRHIETSARSFSSLEKIAWPRDPDYPRTAFEKRLAHLPVHRLRLRKS